MSLKLKLTSLISLFFLILGVVIIGVFAARTQTINLKGNINFNIADKSIWVKSVSISNDNYTEEPITDFMPGYINSNLNLNISDQVNSYGSFALNFELINTTTSIYDVTATYTGAISFVTVSTSLSQIPASSTTITEITSSTPTTKLSIIISNPNGESIDLSEINISIEEYVTSVSSFSFYFDDSTMTASVTNYTGADTIVAIPSTVSKESTNTATEGTDYIVTSIGSDAFMMKSSITSITIPDSVTSIGQSAFYGCSSLTSITIPNSVTSINDGAFQYCSFTSITIPDSVTSIGGTAFSYCSSLTSITVNTITPPILNYIEIPSNVINIYVPAESVDAYRSASGWSSYADIITAIA